MDLRPLGEPRRQPTAAALDSAQVAGPGAARPEGRPKTLAAATASWIARPMPTPPRAKRGGSPVRGHRQARAVSTSPVASALIRSAERRAPPRLVGAGRQGASWSRREMLDALVEAFDENGAWPSGKSWERTTAKHPARRTYVQLFGSWATATAAAEAQLTKREDVGRPRPK